MKSVFLLIAFSILSLQAFAGEFNFQCQFKSSENLLDSPGVFTWVYVNSELLKDQPIEVIGVCTKFSRVSHTCLTAVDQSKRPVACDHENLGKYSASK